MPTSLPGSLHTNRSKRVRLLSPAGWTGAVQGSEHPRSASRNLPLLLCPGPELSLDPQDLPEAGIRPRTTAVGRGLAPDE